VLDVFWTIHDPTQVNRQGPDYGKQSRTALFFHSPEQEAAAKKSKQALEASGSCGVQSPRNHRNGPLLARREYHQRYLEKRGAAVATFKLRRSPAFVRPRVRQNKKRVS